MELEFFQHILGVAGNIVGALYHKQ